MPTDTIRASPYEKGLYFVGGTVGTSQWQVGTRYTLERVLGHGGFSSVCLAIDQRTGEKVALKRIPDVLSSPENAKRVLREVCILRRMTHPNIIGIKDCFVRPSATGQCRLIGGKLVNLSIDVYIAMEYAEGGDLFHLKGQMSAEEVKSIMWQLTYCIKYLHDLHVWHRDLKSQNVFVTWENGEVVAKLGDFGSARSAIPDGYPSVEQRPPSSRNNVTTLQPRPPPLHSVDSYDEMHRSTHHSDIYVRVEEPARHGRTGFKAPLTRVVATPCYRAPEVVMSRGGYTAAIDIWGLGCILGELLQRIAHVGSAATPNLQIAPLFAIHDMPRTPEDGEKFGVGPSQETTRKELQALFDVIGTPAWADLALVELPAWRNYLHRMPGMAPTLYRRFAAAGEVAIDLLGRMLAFDPSRRCSADEALGHEYFGDMQQEDSGMLEEAPGVGLGMHRRSSRLLHTGGGSESALSDSMPSVHSTRTGDPAAAGAQREQLARGRSALVGSPPPQGAGGQRPHAHFSPTRRPSQLLFPTPNGSAALQPSNRSGGSGASGETGPGQGAGAGASPRAPGWQLPLRPPSEPSMAAEAGGQCPAGRGEGDVAMTDATPFDQQQPPQQVQQQQQQQQPAAEPRSLHYSEEKDPARALGMLEEEMASITLADATPGGEGCQKLRRMLELECEAMAASHGGSFSRGGRGGRRRAKPAHDQRGVLAGLLQKAGGGLQLDVSSIDIFDDSDNDYEPEWSPHPGAGKDLDPEHYLGPQRHGEWTAFTGAGPPPGPQWGVTAMPPGMDEATDPHMAAVIKAQQLR